MAQDILIIDDEQDIRDLISGILEDEGYSTRCASDGVSGLEEIIKRQPHLVILDVWLGDSDKDGIKILDTIKRDHPFVQVVMISGHSTIETAVTAIKKGAYDFIEKPFQVERLLLVIQRAIESAQLKRENNELKKSTPVSFDLIGQSSNINQIKQLINKNAETNSRIMIQGLPGTEKESIARLIHHKSKRAQGPFIVVNCASIYPDRVEADLFGTEIQNLSPDIPRKIGLLEQAHKGTIFFDEITELPLPIQGKIVKFLQDGFFYRLGSDKKIEVDVRVLGSSNANIQERIDNGHLRVDLYNRLNVVTIDVPQLKERSSDVPLLASFYLEKIAASYGASPRKFSEEAMIILQSYSWPGNQRQLRNVIEWIYINHDPYSREYIRPEHLPTEVKSSIPLTNNWDKASDIIVLPLREARETFERDYLKAQMNRFGGNISQTARFIGMERSALHRKLRALGLADHRNLTSEEENEVVHRR